MADDRTAHSKVRRHRIVLADFDFKAPDWRDAFPFDIGMIPDTMGINLCSVEAIRWTEIEDGQIVELAIEFLPAKDDAANEETVRAPHEVLGIPEGDEEALEHVLDATFDKIADKLRRSTSVQAGMILRGFAIAMFGEWHKRPPPPMPPHVGADLPSLDQLAEELDRVVP